MKKITLFVSMFIVCTTYIFAQAHQPAQQPDKIVLKPTIIASDLIFAFKTLNSIDIQGSEVDEFLVCKNLLKDALQKASDEKKTENDKIVLEIPLTTAQNLVNYLQRAKFSGAQAEQYKRLLDALVDSTKPYKK
jgi:hypothetical protein